MVEEPRRGPPVVEIVLPTYITRPGEHEQFYPSEVKAIAEKVWTQILALYLRRSTKSASISRGMMTIK